MTEKLDPAELLERFVQGRDEAAFTALVHRYGGLVRGTALRIANGRADVAEEAVQGVFIELARRAPRLLPNPRLGGWLHEVTCTTTLSILRSERRRLRRESTAREMTPTTHSAQEDPPWRDLEPHLDAALRRLPAVDREAIVQRYLHGQATRAIAEELQLSPEAVQKRITRALERLRQQLHRRGVTVTGAALAAALPRTTDAGLDDAIVQRWSQNALSAETPATSGSMADWFRVIRSEPLAFAAGAAAMAVVGWGASLVPVGGAHPTGSPLSQPAIGPAPSPLSPAAAMASARDPDPFEALVAATRDPVPLARQWKVEAILATVSPETAREFILRAETECDAATQGLLYPQLFAKWAEADTTAAMDFALRSGINERLSAQSIGFVSSLWWRWLETDSRAAREWLVRHWQTPGFQRGTAQGNMGAQLGTAMVASLTRAGHASEALDLLEQLPVGSSRDEALEGLADDGSGQYRHDWSAGQHAALLDTLAAGVAGPLGTAPLRRTLAQWAKRAPDEARRWIDGTNDPTVRFAAELAWLSVATHQRLIAEDTEAGRTSYTHDAVRDHADRANRALAAASGQPFAETLQAIAEAWPNPREAADWLRDQAQHQPEGVADQALAQLAARWATTTLNRWTNPALQRPGVAGPADVFALCETIVDPDLREACIGGLVRRWNSRAPKQTADFLAQSSWPQERLERLSAIIDPEGTSKP